MKKILIFIGVFIALLVGSCSNDYTSDNDNEEVSSSANHAPTTTTTTIKAEFLKSVNNKAVGNFTDVHFEVENYVNNTLLSGRIECAETEQRINCETKTDLKSLKPGIYRFLVKTKNGILGTDLFEIMPGIIPVVVTIDNESTGFYLISLITKATGIREDELYRRIRVLLGADPSKDYDLEPTLYDLFMYYQGSENARQALNKMIAAIQASQPLQNIHGNGVASTLKPLY